MVFDSWKPVIKFQTVLGGVQFILSVGSLSYILDTLRKYHDKDRLNFNCHPKPSDFIRQRCYNSYIFTVTKPHGLIPRNVVAVTLGVLCLCWVNFAIHGAVALRKRPGHRNNRNAKKFLYIYFIHVFFRILFLGVMLGLVCSYQTLFLPSVFKCEVNQILQTNSQTTPSPLNQTKITLQCNDLHHKEKSNQNIAFIYVGALVMVLSICQVLHLGRNRENFVQALIGDIGDDKLLPSLPTITNTEIEGDKDFIVTWSEAEANSSNSSIKYRMECWKQFTTGPTKVFQQGDIVETRHTITGLEYDTEYEVKLFAVNEQGDSKPDVRRFKTKSGLPEKPTVTNTETEVDKDLTVTWSEAEANSTNRSIKYRLECRKRLMTGPTKVFEQGNIVETRHTITGLEYDTEYEVKLFAVNEQGDSEPDVRRFKTKSGLPEKPAITNTETVVDKDLIITWSEAEANSTNRSIKYRLECRKQLMTGSTKVFEQGDIVETRHTITGLEYDTEHAVNEQGDSEPDVRRFKTKSETVIMPGENTSAQTGNSSPPELNKKLPKLCDLSVIFKRWETVELPVDILLLVVEDCEFLSCFAYLKKPFKSYHKSTSYVYFGYMDDQRKKMKIALKRCSKGPDAPGASLSASKASILLLRPKAIFSVGACSGLNNKKVKLGDVVVSAKLITAAHKTPPSRDIGNLIQHVADGWKAPLQNADEYNINVHCDGVVLSISEANRDMISQYPEAIAVEMEGGGVYAAAHDLKTEWLVVKGIKDFEGETQSSSKEWKQIACVMAASVVANILNDPVIFQDWPHFNAGSTWNIDKDPNQLRCEIGNIVEKLDTIIARQEETRDRDKLTNDFDWMRTTVGNLRDRLNTLTAQQHDAQDQEKMRNDIDQMRSEVGNIKDKLESLMMARQEETQHQRQSKWQLLQAELWQSYY